MFNGVRRKERELEGPEIEEEKELRYAATLTPLFIELHRCAKCTAVPVRVTSVNVTRSLSLVSPSTCAIEIGKSFSYRVAPSFELSCQIWL